MGRRSCKVNSFHHQAPRRIGRGLRAVAWSDAECMTDRPEHPALFEVLVAAAQGSAAAGRELRAA